PADSATRTYDFCWENPADTSCYNSDAQPECGASCVCTSCHHCYIGASSKSSQCGEKREQSHDYSRGRAAARSTSNSHTGCDGGSSCSCNAFRDASCCPAD